jgi:DNA-directed RNA polymerase specialized sigma24 family protein
VFCYLEYGCPENSIFAETRLYQRWPRITFVKRSKSISPIPDEELDALICDCINLLLGTLPPKQANIVHAIDLAAAAPRLVAETQGLSLDEMNMHLALGRQGLKDRFGEMYMISSQLGAAGCNCDLADDPET